MSRSILSIVLVPSFALLSCQEATTPASPEPDVLLSPSVEASSELVYEIEQDGNTVQVQPLPGSESASSFYAFRSGGTGDSGDTGFEESNTTRLFLYESPDGTVSFFFINDAPFDGSGGNIAFGLSGLPSDAAFVVEDDPTTQDVRDTYSSSALTWAWNAANSDGTVISGGFGEPFETTVTPGTRSGISRWEFLTGSLSSPSIVVLDLSKPLTIRTAGANSCDEEIDIARKQIEADFGDRFTLALAEPQPLSAGTRISDSDLAEQITQDFLLQQESCFVFVDPAPVFAFDHRVQYLVISTQTQAVQKLTAVAPPFIDGSPRWRTFEDRLNSPDLIVPTDLNQSLPILPPPDGGPVVSAVSLASTSSYPAVPGTLDLDRRNLTIAGNVDNWSVTGNCKDKGRKLAIVIISGRDSYIRNSGLAVRELLETTYGFDKVTVMPSSGLPLQSPNPAILGLYGAVEGFELQVGGFDPCDQIVVYVVSHGLKPKSTEIVSPGLAYDKGFFFKKNWNYEFKVEALPAQKKQSLTNLLKDRFPTGTLVVVIDACFSGSFDRFTRPNTPTGAQPYTPNPGQSVMVFASAREDLEALGGSGVERAFDALVSVIKLRQAIPTDQMEYTELLTDYLRENRGMADRDGDGVVSKREFRSILTAAHSHVRRLEAMDSQKPPTLKVYRGSGRK